MIQKALNNKKRNNIILLIITIILFITLLLNIIYKTYYNNKTSKESFLNINKQNTLCNLDIIKTPYNIYKNYYITTSNNNNYIIIKISKKGYNSLLKYDFTNNKYNIKGISKKLNNNTINNIKKVINEGNIEFNDNVLYIDTTLIPLLNKINILLVILIIINIYLIIINKLLLNTITLSKNEIKSLSKENYIKYDRNLYISNNTIFKKDTLDIINIKDIILMYQKDNHVIILTSSNIQYKFKIKENYDLFDIIISKNKDIFIGINSKIKKEIKNKYNITLKEV